MHETALSKAIKERDRKEVLNREFYNPSSFFGYFSMPKNCRFGVLLGGRQAGKSYAITKAFVKAFVKHGIPFYWVRLNEAGSKKLLSNNAEKLVDPDIRRKYKLDLITKGNSVYDVKRDENGKIKSKKLFAVVLALSTFYSDKGSGYFDNEFLNDPKMKYHVCLDEFQKEKNEKSQGDICYQFVNQMENIMRNTKQRMKIILIGNTLEEASDILAGCFNFIPVEFGRFYLPRKHCIIEYMEPTEKYKAMRKDSIADILMADVSTFTNKIDTDTTLIYKGRLIRPLLIIKFTKNAGDWYTLWDSNILCPYNGEKVSSTIAMRPYIDEFFNAERRDNVIIQFDTRCFNYRNLITFKKFQNEIRLIKPRKA